MTRPLLLDLFCGAGGAAMGYSRAGFDVIGVDLHPQHHYPFLYIRADALEILRHLQRSKTIRVKLSNGEEQTLGPFDAIHASPPCQCYTALRSVFDSSKYEDLVAVTRDALNLTYLPWVIENVVGAPLRRDLLLCAAPFGLRSYRHRIFECTFPVVQPLHPKHTTAVNRRKKNRRGHWDAGGFVTVVGDIGSYVGPEALGIDWMTGQELSQSIPPAYTEYIGKQLLAHLQAAEEQAS